MLQIHKSFSNCRKESTNQNVTFILQRSHFGFGNAEAPWKSFHAHEWATFFVNSILTHSLVVRAMYSQRIPEGLPKFGWMTTKSIITLLYLWRKMFHLESKPQYSTINYLLPFTMLQKLSKCEVYAVQLTQILCEINFSELKQPKK